MSIKDTVKDMVISHGVPKFIRIKVDCDGTWVEGSNEIDGPIIYSRLAYPGYIPDRIVLPPELDPTNESNDGNNGQEETDTI